MVTLTYILMYVITSYVIIVSYYLAKKSSSLIPVVPIAAMYYWSLFGVWSWIPMKLRGESSYTEVLMFTVNIDGDYFLSVLYYSLFIFIFATFECHMIRNKQWRCANKYEQKQYYQVSIEKLADSKLYNLIVLTAILSFVLLWIRDLSAAFVSDSSAYKVSRWDSSSGNMEGLSQFIGNLFAYLSIPLLFVKKHRIKRIIYLCSIIVFYGMNFLLGNRNILLCSLVIGIIIYSEVYGLSKLLRLRNIVIGLLLLALIQFISFVRGASVNALLSGDFSFNLWDVLSSTTSSSEKEAAQVSMYGVLKRDIPFTYWSSILFLISTIIPSFLGIERPMRVYEHYVKYTIPHGVDYGMTINHVTAWYINFGVLGVIMGALLWGYTLRYFFVRKRNYLYMYGATLFSAASIPMIRDGGIECYKGCLLLGTIIPMLIVWYCMKGSKRKVSLSLNH